MSITVTTNNHQRPVLYGSDLTDAERAEFDYIDWQADDATFFRYRGQVYDLSEFIESVPLSVHGWDAYRADSFFSGLVIRYIQCALDGDHVVVGMVLA